VRVTEFRERMGELKQEIYWVPDNVKDGQFGKEHSTPRLVNLPRPVFSVVYPSGALPLQLGEFQGVCRTLPTGCPACTTNWERSPAAFTPRSCPKGD
jgi:hypothetical protein